MYEPKIGDIALYEGEKVVVLHVRDYRCFDGTMRRTCKIRFKKRNEIMYAVPIEDLEQYVGTEPTINKLKAGRRAEK